MVVISYRCYSHRHFRLWLIWKLDMFYNSHSFSIKNIIWCRKTISFMGLGVPNMAKMRKTPVFEQKIIFKMPYGGYACMEKFYFGNSISSLFGAPICQILSFGRPHSSQQHYSAEKRPLKKTTLASKKWRLKVWNFTTLASPW